ncbi:putative FAD dependent oxidoreductase [Lineolata rhizophorae]|uniref:Putative FAD dependent oxidoreductase n=1 Tax=Lineolata rhizophorae TaxID=578093 RepID=A0A6A6PG01_9PEZI|nr:putative FAD dependent oxidoreductase [Lineolata rhizophorae]
MSAETGTRNIVVVGGGIIGSTTAYFLSRHPSYDPSKDNITLLEASKIAGGASGKAGGLLATWAYPAALVPLSFRLHRELADAHDGRERWGYREVNCGQVDCKGRAIEKVEKKSKDGAKEGSSVSLEKRSAAALKKLKGAGVPEDLDWLDADAVNYYESMSGPGETAQVHPYLFTTSMAKLAEEKGVKIELGAMVKSINTTSTSEKAVESVMYSTPDSDAPKTILASIVVLAAGPWTSRVWPSAPITALRAHSVTIKPTRPVSAYALFTEISLAAHTLGRPAVRAAPEIYARPDGEVYACGEGDSLVPLPATTANVEVDQQRCDDIIASVGTVSEELREGEVHARQACYLPNTAVRGGPFVGLTSVTGLIMAAGHTCWGIQNAPGTGKCVSEMCFDGKVRSANLSSLDPRKFGV